MKSRCCAVALAARLAPCVLRAASKLSHVHAAASLAARQAHTRPRGLAAPPPPASPASPERRSSSGLCKAYQDPEIYDIAFNFREFDKEVRLLPVDAAVAATHASCTSPRSTLGTMCLLLPSSSPTQAAHLLAMHKKHCGGGPLTHFLEVACGPARHAALLAQSGACVQASGLDLSPGMLKYAQQQAEAAGVGDRLRFIQADMSQGACCDAAEMPGLLAGRCSPAASTNLPPPPPPPPPCLSVRQRGGRPRWRRPPTWRPSCWAAWRTAWTMRRRWPCSASSGGCGGRESRGLRHSNPALALACAAWQGRHPATCSLACCSPPSQQGGAPRRAAGPGAAAPQRPVGRLLPGG